MQQKPLTTHNNNAAFIGVFRKNMFVSQGQGLSTIQKPALGSMGSRKIGLEVTEGVK